MNQVTISISHYRIDKLGQATTTVILTFCAFESGILLS